MMPRKKRILVTVISIIFVACIIMGALIFVLLKTDLLKSKEELFAKYFVQNFEIIDMLSVDNEEINNALNSNKYKSELIGTVKYIEDKNTSNENTNNEINNIQLKINSEIDNSSNYTYSRLEINDKDENLAGLEYIKDGEIYGLKLDGIKQFVSVDTSNVSELADKLDFDITDLKNILQKSNIKDIFSFSEDEKLKLQNTYLSVISNNVSKEKYGSQNNSLITVNNRDVQANSYYIKLTVEEYNNLCIKILEQLKNDEIILGKIDKIEKLIKEKNPSFENETTLREQIVEQINEKIKEIQDNNIGQEEVKITVYETNEKTIRTSIEKNNEKLTLDTYNNIVKIDKMELGDNEKETIFTIQKSQSNNVTIEYEQMNNNETSVNCKIIYTNEMQDNSINKNISIEISNQKYSGTINIVNNIEILNSISTNNDWEENNIELNDYSKEQVETITNIVSTNIQEQIENIINKFSENEFKTMLENLNLINKSSVEISDVATVTETEKNRYNSQFEFFVSENLTKDNIKDLLEVTKNNFSDAKFYTKDGQLIDIDIDKAKGTDEESKEYKSNISELVIVLKENSTNEDKQEKMVEFLNNNNTKYNVSIQYNKENGLAQLVRIQLVEEKK